MSRFAHFVAIDWSGAAGERHKGIALAQCATGNAAPALVREREEAEARYEELLARCKSLEAGGDELRPCRTRAYVLMEV